MPRVPVRRDTRTPTRRVPTYRAPAQSQTQQLASVRRAELLARAAAPKPKITKPSPALPQTQQAANTMRQQMIQAGALTQTKISEQFPLAMRLRNAIARGAGKVATALAPRYQGAAENPLIQNVRGIAQVLAGTGTVSPSQYQMWAQQQNVGYTPRTTAMPGATPPITLTRGQQAEAQRLQGIADMYRYGRIGPTFGRLDALYRQYALAQQPGEGYTEPPAELPYSAAPVYQGGEGGYGGATYPEYSGGGYGGYGREAEINRGPGYAAQNAENPYWRRMLATWKF